MQSVYLKNFSVEISKEETKFVHLCQKGVFYIFFHSILLTYDVFLVCYKLTRHAMLQFNIILFYSVLFHIELLIIRPSPLVHPNQNKRPSSAPAYRKVTYNACSPPLGLFCTLGMPYRYSQYFYRYFVVL